MKVLRDDLHVLTGSYVLDAISDAERTEFERHLHHCASCEAEVRGLRETAARLATAQGLKPPARMEQRVLGAAYQTRQLPPLPAARPPRARPVRRREAGRLRAPRLASAVALASVAAAVGLGVTQVTTRHQLQSAQAITQVITAPDARVETGPVTGGGTVTVVASARHGEAVVTAAGMPALPSGRVYQVWVLSPSGARSAGLLGASQMLASGIRPGDRIGITVEPAGGTAAPTTSPVALLPA